MSPNPRIEVAAGLVFREGKLLVTQRRAGDHLGGFWEFPGGKREGGEEFEDCLRRELMEELGIEVEVLELLESIDHDYPGKAIHLRFFRCRWLRHEPRLIECHALGWVARGELSQYDFPAADARLLSKLESRSEIWL